MKTLILEQGADALIIRTDTQMINSIPYESISEMTKKPSPTQSGSGVFSDFIIIIAHIDNIIGEEGGRIKIAHIHRTSTTGR